MATPLRKCANPACTREFPDYHFATFCVYCEQDRGGLPGAAPPRGSKDPQTPGNRIQIRPRSARTTTSRDAAPTPRPEPSARAMEIALALFREDVPEVRKVVQPLTYVCGGRNHGIQTTGVVRANPYEVALAIDEARAQALREREEHE